MKKKVFPTGRLTTSPRLGAHFEKYTMVFFYPLETNLSPLGFIKYNTGPVYIQDTTLYTQCPEILYEL